MSYAFVSRSPSDPNGKNGGLGFNIEEAATRHATRMNELIDLYEHNSLWNKEFWKTKPAEWIVEKQQ